jgi:hypothetical protein
MQEQNKNPNKLELYKEKMMERDQIEKNFNYNPYGRGGNGAPNRDNNGNVITTRKIIENNLYTENLDAKSNYTMTNQGMGNYGIPSSNVYSNQINGKNNINSLNANVNNMQTVSNNYGLYQHDYNSPQFNLNYLYNNINKNEQMYRHDINSYNNFKSGNGNVNGTQKVTNYNNYEQESMINNIIQSNNPNLFGQTEKKFTPSINNANRSLSSGNKNTMNNNQQQVSNRNEEIKLLPQQSVRNDDNNKLSIYQSELLKQIEEKKLKKEEEKRKEIELDKLEEEKFRQHVLKKKELEEQVKNKKSIYQFI